jgi:hypothetical protein
VLHQFPEKQELKPGERYRPAPGVHFKAAEVQSEISDLDYLVGPALTRVPGVVVALIGNRAITELYAHACTLHVHTSLHGSAANWFTAKRDNLSARSGNPEHPGSAGEPVQHRCHFGGKTPS